MIVLLYITAFQIMLLGNRNIFIELKFNPETTNL